MNATIAADAGLNQQICPGDSAILNATGGSSYQWDQGATTQQIIVYPNVTTIYTVTVSSGSNCTGSDQVEVTVLSPPLADAGTNENICIGDSVVLNASGGTNYFWSPGNILSQQFSVAPIANTTYNVIVTDANGCSASDQVDVLVNNLPIADCLKSFLSISSFLLSTPIVIYQFLYDTIISSRLIVSVYVILLSK